MSENRNKEEKEREGCKGETEGIGDERINNELK